jgi:N-acetyl-gamma-glutamyl-phosphate reductase
MAVIQDNQHMPNQAKKKISVGIIGATGYAGAELVRILCGHPDVNLTVLTSRQYSGIRFDRVYPAMQGRMSLVCEALSMERLQEACEVIFCALPHEIPMTIVPELIDQGKRVIDLSADFRFNDPALYESVYQHHTATELLERAVYGLSEIYARAIRDTALIGNPGCYPTSALLPMIPLLRSGLIDPGSIIIDAKSGVSGAGRSLSLGTHFCQVNDSFKAYKVAEHRHNPEIDAILSREAGESVSVLFVPHLVPMTRGMLTTLYAGLQNQVTAQDIRACLEAFYEQSPFVRICPEGSLPETLYVKGTNYCDIGFKLDQKHGRVVLISAIDNLVKGAAGQAVQNMNIMCGLSETAGLMQMPYPV